MQVNYFHFVAEEIRAGLASLGMRSLDELTGRSDLLRQRDHPLSKTTGLDLSFISRFVGPCKTYADRIDAKVHILAFTISPFIVSLHVFYSLNVSYSHVSTLSFISELALYYIQHPMLG